MHIGCYPVPFPFCDSRKVPSWQASTLLAGHGQSLWWRISPDYEEKPKNTNATNSLTPGFSLCIPQWNAGLAQIFLRTFYPGFLSLWKNVNYEKSCLNFKMVCTKTSVCIQCFLLWTVWRTPIFPVTYELTTKVISCQRKLQMVKTRTNKQEKCKSEETETKWVEENIYKPLNTLGKRRYWNHETRIRCCKKRALGEQVFKLGIWNMRTWI